MIAVSKTNGSARPVVLRTHNLIKDLPLSGEVVHAVRSVNLEIYRGERVAVIGPSGSGKSTLLGLMGGLDAPTSGVVEIDGVDITRLSEARLTEIRNEKIGFVFQFFNLVPTLTALENVMLPLEFARRQQFNPRQRARELLDLLGLKDRLNHRPSQLSGGQQQRVAIARALANNPPLLMADEPTGNLDTESGRMVLTALEKVQAEMGTTIIVVTHDPEIASQMERIFRIVDGQLVNEMHEAVTSA